MQEGKLEDKEGKLERCIIGESGQVMRTSKVGRKRKKSKMTNAPSEP